ncbi:MAG TPA: Hsp20/alpha crystallin family protein [Candidatus Luteimonas excrementigallinarum]|nr:Hsp20/alpha crystallin family protein [Candidatus Luteimonas excrementigallinarum]
MRNLMRQSQQWPVSSAFPEDVRQVFNQFFSDEDRDGSSVVTSQWAPRVDIKEEAERFLILADLPGIDPQDVEVLMDKGILSIKGERKDETREEGGKFSRIERRYGSFHRRFALPDSADADGVTAAGSNGVLEISIPKRAESTPRRIQVGAGAK